MFEHKKTNFVRNSSAQGRVPVRARSLEDYARKGKELDSGDLATPSRWEMFRREKRLGEGSVPAARTMMSKERKRELSREWRERAEWGTAPTVEMFIENLTYAVWVDGEVRMRIEVDTQSFDDGHCAVSMFPAGSNHPFTIGYYGTGKIFTENNQGLRAGPRWKPATVYEFTMKRDRLLPVIEWIRGSAMRRTYSVTGFNCSEFAAGLYRCATGSRPPGEYKNSLLKRWLFNSPSRMNASIRRRDERTPPAGT